MSVFCLWRSMAEEMLARLQLVQFPRYLTLSNIKPVYKTNEWGCYGMIFQYEGRKAYSMTNTVG